MELQVGDVRNLGVKDFEDTIIALNDAWVEWQESENGEVIGEYGAPILVDPELRYRYEHRVKCGTLHRPTPAGLVQVWPEVKG